MKYWRRCCWVLCIALLMSCASGPKPPSTNVDHAQEIENWVQRFANTCLDRNLTANPFPVVETFIPRKLRFNHGHLLAANDGSGVPHSCALWQTTGGWGLISGEHHVNSEARAGWNTRFFIYQNHQTLVNEVKRTFGVIYHEAQRSIQSCSSGTHHTMLLRDGKTVLYLDFLSWSSRGAHCRDNNQYQAVMLRMAQPCRQHGQITSICGPQHEGRAYLGASDGRLSTMIGGWVADSRWVNSADVLDDVFVSAIDVLNLDRLDPDQQLEAAMRWEEQPDPSDYFMRVAELSAWIARQKAGLREENEGEQQMISQQLAEQRQRQDNFANMFEQSFGQVMSNLQQSSIEIQQRQTEMAEATRETLQRQQQAQAVRALAGQRAFDSRQLPMANPMTRPLPAEDDDQALPENLMAMREHRCHASEGYRWDSQTAECKPLASAQPRSTAPMIVGAAPRQPASSSVGGGASSSTGIAGGSRDKTPNQCWFLPETPHSSCVVTEVEWRDGDVVLRNRNQCSRRIYISACGQRAGHQDFCAASGIMPGGRWSHRIYESWQPTGQYSIQWVGSDRGVEDWTCASEAGWRR